MFTLKNVSGNEVEVRYLNKWVEPDGTVDIKDEKLHEETADAYITVKTTKDIKGKTDDGALIWEDEDVYRAWPKAHWEKVTKTATKATDKEEK